MGGESVAEDNLKEISTIHWISPNNGTNGSGFTALPGGEHSVEGIFDNIGYHSHYRSSTEFDISNAFQWDMWNDNSNLFSSSRWKVDGFSVRCLKD